MSRYRRPTMKHIAVLTVAIAASLAVTCDWFPESFGPEYSDSSTNFIAAHVLAAPPDSSDTGSTVPLGATARWDWGWRGLSGDGNTFPYMSLTDDGTVGTEVTSGAYTLADTSAVWRLELVNLAGDPYLEGPLHAAWESFGAGSYSVNATNATSHGKSILLFSKYNEWSGFDPNEPGFILDEPSLNPDSEYLLRAFSLQSSIQYLIDDYTGMTSDNAETSALSDSRHSFTTFRVNSSDIRFMTAPSTNIEQSVTIDDLRITRTDLDSRLKLMLAPSDTVPSLVAGQYEFSVWVRFPDDALSYDDSRRIDAGWQDAPFAAKQITLRINQTAFLIERETPIQFEDTFDITSDWTRIALRMEGGNLDRFDESSTEAVLELSIFPYDFQNPDCGIVLISDPQLRFFKNGYTD